MVTHRLGATPTASQRGIRLTTLRSNPACKVIAGCLDGDARQPFDCPTVSPRLSINAASIPAPAKSPTTDAASASEAVARLQFFQRMRVLQQIKSAGIEGACCHDAEGKVRSIIILGEKSRKSHARSVEVWSASRIAGSKRNDTSVRAAVSSTTQQPK
jgi:hypothetical protein